MRLYPIFLDIKPIPVIMNNYSTKIETWGNHGTLNLASSIYYDQRFVQLYQQSAKNQKNLILNQYCLTTEFA